MTAETSNEPTTADPDIDPANPATDPAGQSDEDTTDQRGGSEAAKRRVQLREVEAERDGLRSQVAALQRAEVERYAVDLLQDPADLFRDGLDLAELLDESGAVDPALVDSRLRP